MPPSLTLDDSADSEAVGYCHLGEGTLGSHIVSRGPDSSWERVPWEVILHLSHR